MNDTALLGPWVRRFLLEHLIVERNLSRQTQLSYRDTLRLLLPFVAGQCHQSLDQLTVEQVSAERVRAFLQYVEEERQCTSATRNQRLAAIRTLAGFVAEHSPEHIAWCGEIRRIPFKKTVQPGVPYLEKAEMDALLRAPDRDTIQGRRDYALLLFLYNSGARASEAAGLRIADLDLAQPAVRLLGKGNKIRYCPLWPATVQTITRWWRIARPSRRSFSIDAANRSRASASTRWWNVAPKKRLPRSLRWRASASARIRFAIPQRFFSCVPAWTSTRSEPGSGMPRSTPPTSTPSSTWR